MAVLDENKRIEERVVAVVLDLEPLRTILAGEPDLHGVRARRLSRGMALTGEVPSAASADRALRLAAGALPEGVQIENELQIAAPQQVNLEVQIAEVHRSVTEDLGVNWEAFRIRGDEVFGFQHRTRDRWLSGTTTRWLTDASLGASCRIQPWPAFRQRPYRRAALTSVLFRPGLRGIPGSGP